MKKLMIAAAAAAMIGGVQAVTHVETKGHWEKTECGKEWVCGAEGCGTAHKVAISLKTTANKGKTTKVVCQDAACTYWRQQATKKINGLIWEQLDDCTGCVPFGANSTFWTADEALDVEFAIGVGMIGQGTKSKKIEAYGSLAGDDFGSLSWAGFGNMAGTYKAGRENLCGEDEDPSCVMYVKSISGGIAGALVPAEWENVCQECDLIEYDGCCEDLQLENTAAYGTIKITYDVATAKKVAVAEDADDPTEFFKFPAAVLLDADGDMPVNEVVIEE